MELFRQIIEQKENFCGIYCLYCILNGKYYIGSSWDSNRRKTQHYSDLRRNKHQNPYLQHVWNKYGEKSFLYLKLEECEPYQTLEREQHWLDYFAANNPKFGLNINSKATMPPSPKGRHLSVIAKQKLSDFHRGKSISQEQRERIRRTLTGRVGRKLSSKEIENIRLRSSKSYLFLDINNRVIKITNLEKFCRENNLYSSVFHRLMNGDLKTYKHWRRAPETAKEGDFVSPKV